MPAEPSLAGDGEAGEGAVAGDQAAEGIPAPRSGRVGIAPTLEDHGPRPGPRVEVKVQVDGYGAEAVVGGDVPVVGGGPGHAEAWQQGRGYEDRLAAGPSGGAAGHVGAFGVHEGDHAGELPVHDAGAVDVAVRSGDEAGGAGGPDQTLVRVDDLAGGERQPPADLDVPPHPQFRAGGQRGAVGDRCPQVPPYRCGQVGRPRRRRTPQPRRRHGGCSRRRPLSGAHRGSTSMTSSAGRRGVGKPGCP